MLEKSLLLLLLLHRFSCVRLCATPQTAAHQIPPSLGFSRQEHWSGLLFTADIQIHTRPCARPTCLVPSVAVVLSRICLL